jgi:hypothetical protein
MSLKPPKYIRTVRDLIYWLYAELIARAAGFGGNYGFVVSRFKKLSSGEMCWSSSIKDWQKELEKGRVCAYCGAAEGLSVDHIIPISRAVTTRIKDLLESQDNCVLACKACNSGKRDRDVFEWYGKDRLDEVPKLVLSKFLKMAYRLHELQDTLDLEDPNMDGVMDIYDLGVVITFLIKKGGGSGK